MKIIQWLLRRVGLEKWKGYRAFTAYLQAALVKIARPTGNARADLIVWGVYGSVGSYLYEESGLQEPAEDLYDWGAMFFDEVVKTWIGTVTGVKPDSLTKYGMKKWAGKLAAKKINDVVDIGIKSLYPPESLFADLNGIYGGAILNGGQFGGRQIFDATTAANLKKQIAQEWAKTALRGEYRITPLPETDKALILRRNRAGHQRNYQQTHKRFLLATNDFNPIRNAVIAQGIEDEIAETKRQAEAAAKP